MRNVAQIKAHETEMFLSLIVLTESGTQKFTHEYSLTHEITGFRFKQKYGKHIVIPAHCKKGTTYKVAMDSPVFGSQSLMGC